MGSDFMAGLGNLVWIAILIGAVAGAVLLFRLAGGGSGRAPTYTARDTLNSLAEQRFARVLGEALPEGLEVAYKVRLADVLQVAFKRRGREDKRWWQAFTRISSKHVDYVLCAPGGGRIHAAIELDDRSHQQRERRQRDQFVDQAFVDAGIPLLRVPVASNYDPAQIRQRLEALLVTPEESAREV